MMAGRKGSSYGGSRSAGTAYVDLAVGSADKLKADIKTAVMSAGTEATAGLQQSMTKGAEVAGDQTAKTLQKSFIDAAAPMVVEGEKAGAKTGESIAAGLVKNESKVYSVFEDFGKGIEFMLGPWGIGYMAAADLISRVTGYFQDQQKKAQEEAKTITDLAGAFGQLGNAAKSAITDGGSAIQNLIKSNPELAKSIGLLGDAADRLNLINGTSQATFLDNFKQGLEGNTRAVQDFDAELNTLIGYYDVLANMGGPQRDAARAQLKSLQDLKASYDQNAASAQSYEQALNILGITAAVAPESLSQLETALQEIRNRSKESATSLSDLKAAIMGLRSPSMDADEALVTWNGDLASFQEAMKKSKDSIHGTSSASVQLQQQFIAAANSAADLYAANINAGESADKAKAQFDQQIAALEKAAGGFKNLPPAVQDYINSLQRIPSQVSTQVNLDTSGAIAKLQALINKANAADSRLQTIGGTPVPRAAGGMVYGAGTSTSDSIPAMLSNGEFVVKAAAVQAYGPDFLNALNQMAIPRGRLSGLDAFSRSAVPHVPVFAAGVPSASSGVATAGRGLQPGDSLALVVDGELIDGRIVRLADAVTDSRLNRLTQKFHSR